MGLDPRFSQLPFADERSGVPSDSSGLLVELTAGAPTAELEWFTRAFPDALFPGRSMERVDDELFHTPATGNRFSAAAFTVRGGKSVG